VPQIVVIGYVQSYANNKALLDAAYPKDAAKLAISIVVSPDRPRSSLGDQQVGLELALPLDLDRPLRAEVEPLPQ